MSVEPISQREFDTYVKMTSKAILAIQVQGQETLDVLKELVIRNDVRNIRNDVRNNEFASEIKQVKIDLIKLQEKATAGAKLDKFWLTIRKYLIYVLIGGLTVTGGYYAKQIIDPDKQKIELKKKVGL